MLKQYPDALEYGIGQNVPSNWTKIDKNGYGQYEAKPDELQSPTLNITIYDGKANNKSFIYIQNNATYTLPFITENAVCQPAATSVQQTYQWGFSVLQLEITLILLTIWTFGIWIMWLGAHLKLRSRGGYEVPHGLKAVLYLADSIRNDMKDLGEDPDLLTDVELRRLAREHLKNGKVKIQAPEFQTDYHGLWRRSWHWLKDNYLWVMAYVLAVASIPWFIVHLFLVLVMSLTMEAGWGKKSRAFVSGVVFIVGIPLALYVSPFSPSIFH